MIILTRCVGFRCARMAPKAKQEHTHAHPCAAGERNDEQICVCVLLDVSLTLECTKSLFSNVV
jgi:hypothetical protein